MEVTRQHNIHFKNITEDWNNRFYFLVGSYGSGKSRAIAFKLILKMLQENDRKILVVRNVFATIKESCFDLLQEVVEDTGLSNVFIFKLSPLTIICKKTNSKMIFKGLDDPIKLKSINGVSIIWIEEATETSKKAFMELNGRLRTMEHSMHMILTMNPVSKKNWTYKHFIEKEKVKEEDFYNLRDFSRGNIYYNHSTCEDNRHLPIEYIKQLDESKEYDEYYYQVARLGKYGTLGIRVLPQIQQMDHLEMTDKLDSLENRIDFVGMDFGFQTSYNALIKVSVDDDKKHLYITFEYYKNKMTDDETCEAEELQFLKESYELIKCDSAEPKTIKFFQNQGFNTIATKKITRIEQIKKIKRFRKIFVSTDCPETWNELSDLSFLEDKDGKMYPDKFNIDPHTFSAVWYALDDYDVSDLKGAFEILSI